MMKIPQCENVFRKYVLQSVAFRLIMGTSKEQVQ